MSSSNNSQLFHPYLVLNERKSRRTHKNSRDGCPNCKAKRIKCTEELPSCLNCIKKKYRCGYLDFPAEKLDKIRQKNETKVNDFHSVIDDPKNKSLPPDYNQRFSVQHTNYDYHINNNHLYFNNESKLQPHTQESILENFHTSQPFTNVGTLRSLVYRNSLLKLANEFDVPAVGILSGDISQPLKFKSGKDDNNVEEYQNFQAYMGEAKNNLLDDQARNNFPQLQYQQQFDQAQPQYQQPQYHQLQPSIQEPNNYGHDTLLARNPNLSNASPSSFNTSQSSTSITTPIKFELSPKYTNNNKFANDITTTTNNNRYVTLNPLPNAIHEPSRFTKLRTQDSLKNVFLKKYLNDYKSHIKDLNNREYGYDFEPVWDAKSSHKFWVTVYNQSTVLNVYFSFFMDRSLNFLLNVANVIVDGDVVNKIIYGSSPIISLNSNSPNSSNSSSISNSSAASSPDSIIGTNNINTPRLDYRGDLPIFNAEALTTLTKKAYTYYGSLIKDLRESISSYHIEYPTKISMFSAWSVLLQVHGSIDTLSLMFNGTALLFSKIINEAERVEDITPTILVSLNIFNCHSLSSIIPDYHFNVIYEIYDHFKRFKALCEAIYMNEENKKSNNEFFFTDDVNQKNQQFINNKLFQHDLKELENFLLKLITDYYHNIKEINNFYKTKFGMNFDGNEASSIKFVSISLIFELLRHWFTIFPSDAISMGSHACPLKKTFYLFHLAIGKSLVHIISPIRTIMFVDTCHVFCPKIDFDSKIYQFNQFKSHGPDNNLDEFYQSNLLTKISQNLMKIINFFDNRTLFYSYYLSTTSVMEEQFLKSIDPNLVQDETDKYSDLLQVLPSKLPVSEKFVNNFETDIVGFENYPQFNEFNYDADYKRVINDEFLECKKSQNELNFNFDYNFGLFYQDFNPKKLLSELFDKQKVVWDNNKTSLDAIRSRCHSFEMSRKEIKKSVDIRSNPAVL